MTDTHDLSFDEKCDALARKIDKGDVPSPLALARALELPLSYVNSAIAIATIEFVKRNVGRSH